jgi:hypothetical protein
MFLSFGDQVPDPDIFSSVAYWTSGQLAARLQLSGLALDLLAPGPGWLEEVGAEVTGRRVESGNLEEVPGGRLFVKALEHKVPGLPAGVQDGAAFVDRARTLGVPTASMFQWCRDVVRFDHEHRFFVAAGEVVTGSAYRVSGEHCLRSPLTRQAQEHAHALVRDLGDLCPPACTLDLGLDTATGRWVVVEANPAWSSGPYDNDPVGVVDVVEASQGEADLRWKWRPDPALVTRAQEMGAVEVGAPEDLPGVVELDA